MVSINEVFRVGNLNFDIQTEYKPRLGIIVGEIIHKGKILKKITKEVKNREKVEEEVRSVHSKILKTLYEKFSASSKKESLELISNLRKKLVDIVKKNFPESKITFVHLNYKEVEVSYEKSPLEGDVLKIEKITPFLEKILGKRKLFILKVKDLVLVKIYDHELSLLVAVKGLKLGLATLLVEKLKKHIEKDFS
ncbi:MAG: hypothetical protein ABGX27_02510 [Desulfurobacteriaceae bacterium]